MAISHKILIFFLFIICITTNNFALKKKRTNFALYRKQFQLSSFKLSTCHLTFHLKSGTNIYNLLKIKGWKSNIKRLLEKWNSFLFHSVDVNINPLKNCRWKISTYNFFLQKKNTIFFFFEENGKVNTSDNLCGEWDYKNYYITWFIEKKDKKVFYTAEFIWNGKNSKMIKGIIYEEKKRKVLPSYLFRKIVGSFVGVIDQ